MPGHSHLQGHSAIPDCVWYHLGHLFLFIYIGNQGTRVQVKVIE